MALASYLGKVLKMIRDNDFGQIEQNGCEPRQAKIILGAPITGKTRGVVRSMSKAKPRAHAPWVALIT